MEAGLYELRVEAWNGVDALMRIVNIARRAKLSYRGLEARFDGDGRLHVVIRGSGEEAEARWLAAKLERLPEVYSVETRRAEAEAVEELLLA